MPPHQKLRERTGGRHVNQNAHAQVRVRVRGSSEEAGSDSAPIGARSKLATIDSYFDELPDERP